MIFVKFLIANPNVLKYCPQLSVPVYDIIKSFAIFFVVT
jgi:hypothetical protein